MAPDLVGAQQAVFVQRRPADVELPALVLRAPLVPLLAGPELVGLVRDRRRRREVGLPIPLLHRHAAGDLLQGVEAVDPEEFIEVEVAVIALGRPRIGAQEDELGLLQRLAVLVFPAVDHDRVAGQFDADLLHHEGADIAPEDVGLALRRGQEYLVLAGLQGDDQRLEAEVVGGADLT
ncbi:hypothetical protein D3C73_1183680 [compost metagenome]